LSDEQIFVPITFEFGTLDSQTTRGSLKSLKTLVDENQAFHFGYEAEEDKKTISKEMGLLFYPESSEWRSKVISDGRTYLKLLIERFNVI
jgi:hypothetical protein